MAYAFECFAGRAAARVASYVPAPVRRRSRRDPPARRLSGAAGFAVEAPESRLPAGGVAALAGAGLVLAAPDPLDAAAMAAERRAGDADPLADLLADRPQALPFLNDLPPLADLLAPAPLGSGSRAAAATPAPCGPTLAGSTATTTATTNGYDSCDLVYVSVAHITSAGEEYNTSPGWFRFSAWAACTAGTPPAYVTVWYSLGGSADQNLDYTGGIIGDSILVPVGGSADAAYYAIDDLVPEDTEFINLSITDAFTDSGGPAQIVGYYAVGDIADNEPTVSITATQGTVVEGNPAPGVGGGQELEFTVERTWSYKAGLTIPFTVAGTATESGGGNDGDYGPLPAPKQVTLPAGQASAKIKIPVRPDWDREANETVEITLTAGAGYRLGPGGAYAIGQITDDDTRSVNVQSQSIPLARTEQVTVTVSGYRGAEAGVPLRIDAYNPAIISPTWVSSVTDAQGQATLNVRGMEVGTSPLAIADISGNVGSGYEDVYPIWVSLRATDPDAAEYNLDPGRFTVERSGDTTNPLTVYYDVRGSATPGADYAALGNSVVIPAGAGSVGLPVNPLDDTLIEGDEKVVVGLNPSPESPPTYKVKPNAAEGVVTIADKEMTVSVVATDARATEPAEITAGGPAPDTAEFEFRRTGTPSTLNQGLLVYFEQADWSADPDYDYTLEPSPYNTGPGVTQAIYFSPGERAKRVTLKPKVDEELEDTEYAQITLRADPNVGTGLPQPYAIIAAMAEAAIDQTKVIDVTYLAPGKGKRSSAEAEARCGDLDNQNPRGNPNDPASAGESPFKGGFRIFPDAKDFDTRTRSRNLVRVRAELNVKQEGVRVYFRSFDVDDPLDASIGVNQLIDRNENGMDNRGTLTGMGLSRPGPATDSTGYQGNLRPVGVSVFANEGAPIIAQSYIDPADGKSYAEAELAVTFNPGDNFRVVTSVKQAEIDGLNDTTSVKTKKEAGELPTVLHGAAADQLSVWRRLNIERDTMKNTFANGDFLGDTGKGVIANMAVNQGVATLQLQQPNGAAVSWGRDNEWANGLLVVGNQHWNILESQLTTLTIEISANNPPPQQPNATATAYQDDYVWDAQTQKAVQRVNTSRDDNVDGGLRPMPLRWPATSNADTGFPGNRFADAYLQPDWTTLARFRSTDVTPRTHVRLGDPNNGLDDQFRGTRGADAETDVFWVVYLCIAFEPIDRPDFGIFTDGDPDSEITDPPLATTQGVTQGEASGDGEVAVVFLETLRDAYPKRLRSEADQRALVAAHELGHELGLAANAPGGAVHRDEPVNLMSNGGVLDRQQKLSTASLLNPVDIAAVRTHVHSPGRNS